MVVVVVFYLSHPSIKGGAVGGGMFVEHHPLLYGGLFYLQSTFN